MNNGNGRQKGVKCPHCKKNFSPQSLHRHIPVCLFNPAVRARIHQVIEPGQIVSLERYKRLAREYHLPSWSCVESAYGKWSTFCQAFGFRAWEPGLDWDLVMEELRRLSKELHDGQVGPCFLELEVFGTLPEDINLNRIYNYPGGYWALVERAGLRQETKGYYLACKERYGFESFDVPPDPLLSVIKESPPMPGHWCIKTIYDWRLRQEIEVRAFEFR